MLIVNPGIGIIGKILLRFEKDKLVLFMLELRMILWQKDRLLGKYSGNA